MVHAHKQIQIDSYYLYILFIHHPNIDNKVKTLILPYSPIGCESQATIQRVVAINTTTTIRFTKKNYRMCVYSSLCLFVIHHPE